MWVVLIVMSVLGIQILDSAGAIVPGERFDGTASYLVVGVLFFALMRFLRVPTLHYFAKPVLGWPFVVAVLLCGNLVVVQLRGEPFHNLH